MGGILLLVSQQTRQPMKEFTEEERYNYPLDTNSVVLDCGGYEGNFAKRLIDKYGCTVFVFEPIPEFYDKCQATLRQYPQAFLYMHGVGYSKRHVNMRVKGDSTGIYADSGQVIDVQLRSIGEIMRLLNLGKVDLLKLNIEGMEAETIEGMLDDGTIKKVVNLQVQPHTCMPNALTRWPEIQRHLAETHELTYCAPWCWENWQLKA